DRARRRPGTARPTTATTRRAACPALDIDDAVVRRLLRLGRRRGHVIAAGARAAEPGRWRATAAALDHLDRHRHVVAFDDVELLVVRVKPVGGDRDLDLLVIGRHVDLVAGDLLAVDDDLRRRRRAIRLDLDRQLDRLDGRRGRRRARLLRAARDRVRVLAGR